MNLKSNQMYVHAPSVSARLSFGFCFFPPGFLPPKKKECERVCEAVCK